MRDKFPGIENWWEEHFGYDFEGLTENEARYLLRHNSADSIRNSLTAAGQERRLGSAPGTEQGGAKGVGRSVDPTGRVV